MTIKRTPVSAMLIALSIYSHSSSSLEYQVITSLGLEHSDNVLRTRDQKRSDLEQRAGIGFSLTENTKHLTAALDYNAERTDFKNDVQEDDTVLEGQANIRWSPLPQTFSWDVNTSTRNLQRDDRQVDILNNREKRTIISTGPVYTARITPVDSLEFSGRYITTKFEDSGQSDSDREAGRVDWIHKLSPTQDLSAGFEYTKAEFDQNTQSDIENSSAYVSFSSALSNSQVRLRAGYSESKRDTFDNVGGPLLEAAVEFNPANQQILFVAVNRVTDSAIGLGDNPTLSSQEINSDDANFDNVDVVERLFSRLQYSNENLCPSCTVSGSLVYDSQDFDVQLRDETSVELEVGLQYRLSSTMDIQMSLGRESTEFKDENREDDIDSVEIRANYSATSSIRLFALIGNEERQSNIAVNEYNELRGDIGIRYIFQ